MHKSTDFQIVFTLSIAQAVEARQCELINYCHPLFCCDLSLLLHHIKSADRIRFLEKYNVNAITFEFTRIHFHNFQSLN